jgi:Fur family ferric uptake transcriptional regulator
VKLLKDPEAVKDRLKDEGYKLTPQRRATLDVILDQQGKHLSTEDIFLMVKKRCPEIGLATVYRTIQLLEQLGIVSKHNFDDGRSRYELVDSAEDHQHHHLICLQCGRVLEVEGDLLEHLEKSIDRKYRFRIVDHKVKFFGYCNICIDE